MIRAFTAKRAALCGLYLALALIVSLIENALPPIIPALPYAKIGLGNIVLLLCFLTVGVREGAAILVLRCLLGAVFSGNFASILWSLPAAAVAYALMTIMIKCSIFSVTCTSIAGGMVHNAVQMAVAGIIVSKSVLVYMPYMLLAGGLAGLVTGLICHFVYALVLKKSRPFVLERLVYIRQTEK